MEKKIFPVMLLISAASMQGSYKKKPTYRQSKKVYAAYGQKPTYGQSEQVYAAYGQEPIKEARFAVEPHGSSSIGIMEDGLMGDLSSIYLAEEENMAPSLSQLPPAPLLPKSEKQQLERGNIAPGMSTVPPAPPLPKSEEQQLERGNMAPGMSKVPPAPPLPKSSDNQANPMQLGGDAKPAAERNALLADIRGGKKLKPVQKASEESPSPLDLIRKAHKHVSDWDTE